MTSATKPWGPITPLAQKVCKKEIDGFELPFEAINFAQKQWPDGRPVIRYPTSSGFLLFVEGAYENYGFSSEKDFKRAVRKRIIKAKTPAGAISLGPTRAISGHPIHIAVTMAELQAPLRFLAEPGEETKQMLDMLSKLFPKAKVQAAANPAAFWFSAVPAIPLIPTIKKLNTLAPRQQKAFLIIYSGALLNLLAAWATLLGLFSIWGGFLLMFAFLVTIIKCFPLLQPPSKKKTKARKKSDRC